MFIRRLQGKILVASAVAGMGYYTTRRRADMFAKADANNAMNSPHALSCADLPSTLNQQVKRPKYLFTF